MTHLLDVNALLSLAFDNHVFHNRVERWIVSLRRQGPLSLATCAITELGFVRIAGSVGAFGVDVAAARSALARLKAGKVAGFRFLDDGLGADRLPAWVKKSAQTTDGHLLALAGFHGVRFATLDEGIPGAFLIPR